MCQRSRLIGHVGADARYIHISEINTYRLIVIAYFSGTQKKALSAVTVRFVSNLSLVWLFDEKEMQCSCKKRFDDPYNCMQWMTIILLCRTEEELMMARFDLSLSNQRKGAFHSRPHVEIEFSIGSVLFYLHLVQSNKVW